MSTSPKLQVQEIEKHYASHTALSGVSFDVAKGSIFGLLGPNGAGKTSLIRIMTQIMGADKGQILLDGKKLIPADIRRIGYLPEERGLYKKMKVGEQLTYFARLKGYSAQETKIQLRYWFEKFDIVEWWHKKVEDLSKGMQQKIQFIATVLHRPEILILDEPFSGFDPVNTELIIQEIRQLRDEGTTILLSTHRMESVEELCDELAMIHQSKIVLKGQISDIKKQFRTHHFWVETIKPLENNITIRKSEQTPENTYRNLVYLPDRNTSAFLHQISSENEILSFREDIPRIHDIFVKIVQNK